MTYHDHHLYDPRKKHVQRAWWYQAQCPSWIHDTCVGWAAGSQLKWWYNLGYSPSSDATNMAKSHFSGHVRLHLVSQFSTYTTSKGATLENIKSSDFHIQFDPWHYIHWSQVSFAMLQKYQGLLMKRSGWKGNDSDVINRKFLKDWSWDKTGHKKYCFKCKDASYWMYMMQRWLTLTLKQLPCQNCRNLESTDVYCPAILDFSHMHWFLNSAKWGFLMMSLEGLISIGQSTFENKSLQQKAFWLAPEFFFHGKHCIQCLPFKTSVEKPRTMHRNKDNMSPTTISYHSFRNWATGSVRNNHTKTTHWRSDIVNPTATLLCAH